MATPSGPGDRTTPEETRGAEQGGDGFNHQTLIAPRAMPTIPAVMMERFTRHGMAGITAWFKKCDERAESREIRGPKSSHESHFLRTLNAEQTEASGEDAAGEVAEGKAAGAQRLLRLQNRAGFEK